MSTAVVVERGPERRAPTDPASPTPVRIDSIERRMRATLGRAIGWQSLATMFVQVIQSVTTLAMAAVVLPKDFAIWVIASSLFNTQYLLAGLGLGQALIYYKHDPERERDAVDGAFLSTAALGVAGALVFLVGAPLFTLIFHQGFSRSDVVRVTQIMSVAFLCTTLANVPTALIERTLLFRRRALPEIAGALMYAGLVWMLFKRGLGVWSLVYARAAQTAFLAVVFWWLAPIRPRFPPHIRWDVINKLLHYGKFLSAAAVTGYIVSNFDNLAVGRFAGATALGAYGLAYAVTNLVPTFLTQTVGKVSFPLYTSIRGDERAMRHAFAIALHYIAVTMVPATVALLTIAPGALIGIFGVKWAPAAAIIPVLAVYGVARATNAASSTLLAAAGRPDVGLWLNGPNIAVTGLLLWPLARFGAPGIALAFTAGQVGATAIAVYMTRRYWGASVLRRLLPALVASGCAMLAARAIRATHHMGHLQIGTFCLTYLVVLLLLDRHVRELITPGDARDQAQPTLADGQAFPPGTRPWRIVYFGLYSDDYPRNNMMRRGLRQHGVEVIECRAPSSYAPSHMWGTTGRGLGMGRIPFEIREMALGIARTWSVTRQFLRVRGPIDAIVLAEFNQGLSPVAAVFAALRRSALIMDFTMSQYDTAVNDRHALKPWKPRAVWRWLMDAASIHLSDRVLVETGPIAVQYAALFGGMHDKARVSHIGAPEWRFQERPLPVRGDRPLKVLYYGNYVPLHGVDFIVQAAQRLRDDPRFQFSMVGAGQARVRAQAIYAANPSGNVEFMGRVTDDELDRLVAEADICLGIFGTSVKAQLVVSNKVWQCLAVGRPIITGNGPGAASVLRSGEHCLLVPHGDAGAIVDALRLLADDPALAIRIAGNGARLVREQFTSITVARRLIGVVSEVRVSRLAAEMA